MATKVPRFRVGDRLVRYIAPEHRQSSRRAKPGAFMEDVATTSRDGLSVNSLEMATKKQIATIYSVKFSDPRPVAISSPTIATYNNAVQAATTISISWNSARSRWEHQGPNGLETSYLHNPKHNNESHCLIRYTRHLDDFEQLKFARRMAYQPTYESV